MPNIANLIKKRNINLFMKKARNPLNTIALIKLIVTLGVNVNTKVGTIIS